MDDLRLKDAFSDVPPAVHARVLDALREAKTAKRVKPMTALALAAVLILALAGVAYAAVQSGVMKYLFGNQQPTDRQRQMVQNVGMIHESDGIVTTLTDLVFDGRELTFALRFDMTRNAFVVLDHVTINGVRAYETTSNLSDMWLSKPLAALKSPRACGVTVTLHPDYFEADDRATLEDVFAQMVRDGKANVSVGLTLLSPKAALVPVDIYDEDTAAMWERIDAIVAAGDTPISADEPYEVVLGSAWLGDEFHAGLPLQHPIGSASAYADYANMTALDTFSLALPIIAADGADAALQTAYQRSPISDGRVRIAFDEVRFTPFATDIRLRITPEEGGMTNDEIAAIYKWFAIYDEKREPIPLSARAVQSSGSGFEALADGTLAYRVALHLGALAVQPEVVYLVPFNEASSAENPLWAYAIPIVRASGADAE